MVAARDLPRSGPFPLLRDLRAGRLRPRLDDVGPRARRHLRSADSGRRSGGRLQRGEHPDAGSRRLDRLSPLPARHEPCLAVHRRRLPLRVLGLHARPGDRAPAPDLGLPHPARGARGASLRRGLAGCPLARDRSRCAARHAGVVFGRGPAHDRARAPCGARSRLSRRARAPPAPPQRFPATPGGGLDRVRAREPVARGDAHRARPASRERAAGSFRSTSSTWSSRPEPHS